MNDDRGDLVADRVGLRKLAFVGLSGGLIGVGICRFAYTPLVPVMIGEGWMTEVEAGYIGAVNFTGYLVGSILSWWSATHMGTGRAVRLNLTLCVLSLAAVAMPWGFHWLAFWRFVAGYGGAVLLVLVGPAVLAQAPAERWGWLTGIIFTGVGAGVAATGTIVPLLSGLGATEAWSGLAVVALLLAVMTHRFWREPPAEGLAPPAEESRRSLSPPAILLCFAYATYAFGIAPHTVFWVDYLARGLGRGIAVGGLHWTVIGVLAIATPTLLGRIGDRYGFGMSLVAAMAVTAAGVLFPVIVRTPELQIVSSVLFGLTMPSTVALFAGRTAEIGGRQGQRRLWWLMTLYFALVQAAGFYGLSALFDATGAYLPLFAIAGGVLVAGTLAALPVWSRVPAGR